jgi:hypothetical protein
VPELSRCVYVSTTSCCWHTAPAKLGGDKIARGEFRVSLYRNQRGDGWIPPLVHVVGRAVPNFMSRIHVYIIIHLRCTLGLMLHMFWLLSQPTLQLEHTPWSVLTSDDRRQSEIFSKLLFCALNRG